MVSDEKGLPASFDPGQRLRDGSGIDMATTKNVRWVAKLGNAAYGNPTVAGGRVFVGTNNRYPRNPRYDEDRGAVMCFDEATGKFLWQLVVSRLPRNDPFHGDLKGVGVCSSPTVDGDRVYVVTGRCEVVCLDVKGLADGNDGPFQDEGEYVALDERAKPGKQDPDDPSKFVKPERAPKPLPLAPTDADILWRYDMIMGVDSWPHAISNCSVLVHGDLLFVNTSNGVDSSNKFVPSPKAPTLIALDKRTGKLVATDDAGLGTHILHGNWSSPTLATVGDRTLVILGGADGACYAFDATPVDSPGRDTKTLALVWGCDANPAAYRFKDGEPLAYSPTEGWEGPSEIISTPAFHKGRVYVTIGRDPTHGRGHGALTCIDATRMPTPGKTGSRIWAQSGFTTIPNDITSTAVVWQYTNMKRSTAMPAVAGGLVYAIDFNGDLHCLDADTGKAQWVHETGRITLGSPLVADGKIYVGNERRRLYILAASREKKVLAEIRFRDAIDSTPVAANGTLYIATARYLYAIQEGATPVGAGS